MRSQIKRSNSQGKATLEERFADEARFFKAWVENPKVTGAVSPSGRFLARMMARYVDPASSGPIIELGPGTGPVTVALLKRGVAPERLAITHFGVQEEVAEQLEGLREDLARAQGWALDAADAEAYAALQADWLTGAATVRSGVVHVRIRVARVGASDEFPRPRS